MEQISSKREVVYLQYILRYLLAYGGKMYTIEDIFALPEGERAELIDGEMFMMATPTTSHQEALFWLGTQIYNYIRKNSGKCRVVPAPFGVFIKRDEKNYLEPDISVICERDKMDDKGCHGAPDWIIEIVSPSNKEIDYKRKLKVYKEAGVREYWIVDLLEEIVTTYHFEKDGEATEYHLNDRIDSKTIEGLSIDFAELKRYLYEE